MSTASLMHPLAVRAACEKCDGLEINTRGLSAVIGYYKTIVQKHDDLIDLIQDELELEKVISR